MESSNRQPTTDEITLLDYLVSNATIEFPADWMDGLLVRSREDRQTGSLYLFPKGTENENRIYGKTVSEYQLEVEDGSLLIASLNVDTNDKLFELDIWRGNLASPPKPSLN